jgi:anthranilate synthase/aminodeoxychorismate synthase-like glutamine amidotransferase
MQIFYIDHYDSFSFNLIDWLEQIDENLAVVRVNFDDPELLSKCEASQAPIVISPGPNSPEEAASTCELIACFLGKVPILGVCLGHQILGSIAGYRVVKGKEPIHGAKRDIFIAESSVFYSYQQKFHAGVYNSLVLERTSDVGAEWKDTGYNQIKEIQIIENTLNKSAPALGIQFHPESFLSEECSFIRDWWKKVLIDYYH